MGHDALAQKREAAHLGLGKGSSVVACPSLPDGPTEATATAKRIFAHGRPSSVLLPWFAVLAEWDDGRRPTRRDGKKGTVAPDGAA